MGRLPRLIVPSFLLFLLAQSNPYNKQKTTKKKKFQERLILRPQISSLALNKAISRMTEGGSTFLWARPALGRMGPQRFFLEEKLSLNNPSDLRFQHGTVFLYPKFENKKKNENLTRTTLYEPIAPMKSVGIQSVKTNNNSDSDSQTCRRSLKSHSSLHDSF